MLDQIGKKIAAGEAGQYEAAILWQELEKLERQITDDAGKYAPVDLEEEAAKAFYESDAYEGDHDFSLSSACQFAAAFYRNCKSKPEDVQLDVEAAKEAAIAITKMVDIWLEKMNLPTSNKEGKQIFTQTVQDLIELALRRRVSGKGAQEDQNA